MTKQQFDCLPQGTTLYFATIDHVASEIEIDHTKKGDCEIDVSILSTTKQGAIMNAVSVWKKHLEFSTKALDLLTNELMKYI